MTKCAYCFRDSSSADSPSLMCSTCNKNVHVDCLKAVCVPGGLLGDIFFNFICKSCNIEDCERMIRQKISWFAVITLALYNLHRRSDGVSRRGYYHWKIHICNFIDRHWNILFDPSVKRKKSWMGTVSGTLSHFCPTFFLSGTDVLKEPGWWRLVNLSMTPKQIVDKHAESQKSKKKWSASRLITTESSSQQTLPLSVSKFNVPVSEAISNNILDQDLGTASSSCPSDTSDNLLCHTDDANQVFSNNLFADEKNHLGDIDMDVDVEDVDSIDFVSVCGEGFHNFESLLQPVSTYITESSCSSFSILPDITSHSEDHLPQFSFEDTHLNTIPSHNMVIKKKSIKEEIPELISGETDSPATDETLFTEQVIPKSNFVITPKELRIPPWKELERKDRELWIQATQNRTVPMSEYEELQLLSQLRLASKSQELPGFARRLYRKLCVRQQKRQRGLPIFNLDNVFDSNGKLKEQKSVWMKSEKKVSSGDAPILDRFYHVSLKSDCKSEKQKCSFKIRLMGYSEQTCFYSPYTQRYLKPYIRRDYETTPLWLQLLSEIQLKANKKNPNWTPPPRSPIDYCYVRPQHISTVNSLCCEFFYPGIDLSEALQYPDFSCVVLYKKLIVAFAFMVPDVGYNETYITFLFTRPEWRNAGIATFMLYHLIQTCMGKDITLHVSATNSAVILYQKFGFKIEELILDFYDKYLSVDSRECKHALFLRLSR